MCIKHINYGTLDTDTQLTKDIKQRVKSDLGNRYSSDLEVVDILNTASFLDPHFKTKNMEQEDIRLLKERLVDECSSDCPPTTSSTPVIQDGPPPAKKKNLGSFFKDHDKSDDETAMPVISPEQQIVSELDAYLTLANPHGKKVFFRSLSIIILSVKVEDTRLGLAGVVPSNCSNTCASDGPFLCLPCFQQFEKLLKVRLNEQELESQLNAKIT